MKKKLAAMLLAAVMAFSLLPGTAWAAETAESNLPDWYFLFAIIKNVDADCDDGNGVTTRTTYTMTQNEIDLAREDARQFEEYMNSVGVMNAHVDVVEIDGPVTELTVDETGSFIAVEQAAPLLKGKVDLDQYDHVTCVVSLNVATVYIGITGSTFENGTGESCINYVHAPSANPVFPESVYVHEFLHFMERYMNPKWGVEFDLHSIGDKFYDPNDDEWKVCYTDIILNRVEGDAETGTGVAPVAWQYPPHVLRTARELTIPDGVTSIGETAFIECSNLTGVTISNNVTSIGSWAFAACRGLTGMTIPDSVTTIGAYAFEQCSNLTSIDVASGNPAYISVDGVLFSADQTLLHTYPAGKSGSYAIPASVTSIGNGAFHGADSLTDVTIPDGVTSIGDWVFARCGSLTSVTIPNSVTSIGDVAFFDTGLKIVYYSGSEEQWEQISIGENNDPLLNAEIRFNSAPEEPTEPGTPTFTDVPKGVYYADAVNWAVENKVTNGTGGKQFSPEKTCSEGEILTMLYRASKETAAAAAPIPVASYYQDAVNWAYEKGMINGSFDADKSCDRATAVYYIWQAFGKKSAPAQSFTDVDADYADAVSWAVANGITNGTGGGKFSPDRTCMREEIVTLLYRAYA